MEISDKNILVPIDFQEQSLQALEQGIIFAKSLKRQIVVLYVNQEKGALASLLSKEQNELFDQAVLEKMGNLCKKKSEETNVDIAYKLIHHNSIHTAIVEFAKENKSELIILGKGEKEGQAIIGANTSRVLRTSMVPVITVGKKIMNEEVKTILLPLDLSKETRQKVNWALILAELFGARIKVISALWDKHNTNIINQLEAQMKQVQSFIEKKGFKCETHMIKSSADAKSLVPIILKYAEEQGDIDMILIMTQQENGFTEFFVGSNATALIRKSPWPVMSIIPHETGQIIWGI